MAMKRKASQAQRAAKRGRKSTSMSTVVSTITKTDAVPENLRSVLAAAVPIALGAYKSDRHSYENEVVNQAAAALKAAEAALQAKHRETLANQNATISPQEMQKRTVAKTAAEKHLETVKSQLEACKEARKAAEHNVNAAGEALQAAQKEVKAADKDLQRLNDKRTNLSDTLTNDFAFLRGNTSAGAAGKKALRKLTAIGREFGLDGTLLQTLPMTCKKAVAARTDFETMVFSSLQALIEGQIAEYNKQVAEAEPVKAAKGAAATNASGALEQAKAALADAEKALDSKQEERKEAAKAVSQSDAHLRHIWEDMRKACDEQDRLAAEVQNFATQIWADFNTLKEQEAPIPEPEPVEEPAVEAASAPTAEA